MALMGRCTAAVRYQGGLSYTVFSAQGSNPLGNCQISGKGVQKIYEKTVKGYAYSFTGGPSSKMQIPKDTTKAGLQLLHPFIVLQILIPRGQHFSLELRVSDTSNTRRKMYFSTSFSEIKSTPLHCQIPISMVIRNKWLNLAFDTADLFHHCFRVMSFRSIDSIVLGPVCKLRKIFTMRNRLNECEESTIDMESEENLPIEHLYAVGVDSCIQVIDVGTLLTTPGLLASTDGSSSAIGTTEPTNRKSNPNKMENPRLVNIAFGSRMPLTISTVQINTNLPGDGASHFGRQDPVFGKLHNDPKADMKGLPPLKQKVPPIVAIDQKHIQNLVDLKALGSKRQKLVGYNGHRVPTVDEKSTELPQQTTCNAKDDREILLTSRSVDKFGDQVDKSLPKIKDELGSMIVQTESALIPDQVLSDNKQPTSKWQKFGRKKEERSKKDHYGSKMRKATQLDVSKAKEYKHSRYADSPPESPPCGWDKWNAQNNSIERFIGESVSSDTNGELRLLRVYSPANYASLKEESLACSDIDRDGEVAHAMSGRETICSSTSNICESGTTDFHMAREKMLNTLFEEHQSKMTASGESNSSTKGVCLTSADDTFAINIRLEHATGASQDDLVNNHFRDGEFISSLVDENDYKLRLDSFKCYNLDSDELMGHNVKTSFIAPSDMNLIGTHSWSSGGTIRLQDDCIFSSIGHDLSITSEISPHTKTKNNTTELSNDMDTMKETFQVVSESYDQPWIVHEERITEDFHHSEDEVKDDANSFLTTLLVKEHSSNQRHEVHKKQVVKDMKSKALQYEKKFLLPEDNTKTKSCKSSTSMSTLWQSYDSIHEHPDSALWKKFNNVQIHHESDEDYLSSASPSSPYQPLLDCYYDPKTKRYYDFELNQVEIAA